MPSPRVSAVRLLPLALAATLLAGCHYSVVSTFTPKVKGEVRMAPRPGGPPVSDDTRREAVSILQNRIDALGIPEPDVRLLGKDRIRIQWPSTGKTEAEERAKMLELIRPVRLEFIHLPEVRGEGNPAAPFLYEGENRFREADSSRLLTGEEVRERILYDDPKDIVVTGADLQPGGARVDIEPGPQGGVMVELQFDEEGKRKFADFTRKHSGELLAIVLNGTMQSAPKIEEPIVDGTAVIRGAGTTVAEANTLAILLNAGELPADLSLVSLKVPPAGKSAP